jgi:hypothetical protein
VKILLCSSCKNIAARHKCTDCVDKPLLVINLRAL